MPRTIASCYGVAVSPFRTAASGGATELEALEQQHIALPRLYGAPAYGRPRVVPATQVPRPFDPDDLPIAAEMTEEDRAILEGSLTPAAVAVAEPDDLRPRAFSLRSFASRIRGTRA